MSNSFGIDLEVFYAAFKAFIDCKITKNVWLVIYLINKSDKTVCRMMQYLLKILHNTETSLYINQQSSISNDK